MLSPFHIFPLKTLYPIPPAPFTNPRTPDSMSCHSPILGKYDKVFTEYETTLVILLNKDWRLTFDKSLRHNLSEQNSISSSNIDLKRQVHGSWLLVHTQRWCLC